MAKTGKIYRDGRGFFGKEIGEDFEGEVPVLQNALTVTFAKPNTSLEQMHESLKLVLKDIELRLKVPRETKEASDETASSNR